MHHNLKNNLSEDLVNDDAFRLVFFLILIIFSNVLKLSVLHIFHTTSSAVKKTPAHRLDHDVILIMYVAT